MKLDKAKELYTNYLEREQGYSPHTVKLYKSAIDDFCASFKKEDVTKLTEKDLLNYRGIVEAKKESYKTKNLRLVPIRMFLAFLRIRGTQVPEFRVLESFRNRNGHDKLELPSGDEISRLLKSQDDPQADLFVNLIYATGLRLDEALKLKTGEVEETFNIVGKGAKERFVVCLPEIVKMVREYEISQNKPKGAMLFDFSRRTAQRWVSKKSQKLGLKISVHTLRHCYATNLLQRGMDIRSVQELLGHASLVTTQRYTHVTNEQLLNKYRDAFKTK
jgi:site-specific recombinase XerD